MASTWDPKGGFDEGVDDAGVPEPEDTSPYDYDETEIRKDEDN